MGELYDLVNFKFLDSFHRHRIVKSTSNKKETSEISVAELPSFKHPDGAPLPSKREGVMPPMYDCPILTDFLELKNSSCNPTEFLHNADVFTTLSSLRSLIYLWLDGWSSKSVFFKKNPHFCQMDNQGRIFLNTGTNYTVPLEKSTSFLNRFTILEHGQTWEEFTSTSYSGLAKIRLKNGIVIAFTYRMYAQWKEQPIDIILRSLNSFHREIEFHFLNCFLTRKKIWRYELRRNQSYFQESIGCEDLWNRLSYSKKTKLIDIFENRLPNFLMYLKTGIESYDIVHVISSVTSPYFTMKKREDLERLY